MKKKQKRMNRPKTKKPPTKDYLAEIIIKRLEASSEEAALADLARNFNDQLQAIIKEDELETARQAQTNQVSRETKEGEFMNNQEQGTQGQEQAKDYKAIEQLLAREEAALRRVDQAREAVRAEEAALNAINDELKKVKPKSGTWKYVAGAAVATTVVAVLGWIFLSGSGTQMPADSGSAPGPDANANNNVSNFTA